MEKLSTCNLCGNRRQLDIPNMVLSRKMKNFSKSSNYQGLGRCRFVFFFLKKAVVCLSSAYNAKTCLSYDFKLK